MNYLQIVQKYTGRHVKAGELGFFWYRRKDSILWQYYYLDDKPREIHLRTLIFVDGDGVITGINELEAKTLATEGPRSSSYRSRKPTGKDYDHLDRELAAIIE